MNKLFLIIFSATVALPNVHDGSFRLEIQNNTKRGLALLYRAADCEHRRLGIPTNLSSIPWDPKYGNVEVCYRSKFKKGVSLDPTKQTLVIGKDGEFLVRDRSKSLP